MITAYYHPGFAAPIGEHIMPMQKFRLVAEASRAMPEVQLVKPPPVTTEQLLRVHTREYIEAIRTGEPRDLAESQKFPWSQQLFPSVCLTCGGCLAAARTALSDGVAAALASGFHHAHAERGEGFCTFNGLIIAADALHAEGKVRRVAILDLDLHYGNGTALLAVTRPHVRALSIYGNGYWDNTNYSDPAILRHEDGANHRSAALPNGSGRAELFERLENFLPWLVEEGAPDLLLYQAGADPYFEDPYSRLRLDHADLKARDRFVFEFARKHGLPVAWVLAGGYTHDVSKVVQVHVNTFTAALEVYR
jgi:acetoin utilization deacetylase AcuC-like enzyme